VLTAGLKPEAAPVSVFRTAERNRYVPRAPGSKVTDVPAVVAMVCQVDEPGFLTWTRLRHLVPEVDALATRIVNRPPDRLTPMGTTILPVMPYP
jgi:hypothetical protein